MTTYPPAPQRLQQARALDFSHSQIAYVGHEGTTFHLSGPFAPVIGAETGVELVEIAHLDASFKFLDSKGARQDGITNYDTLYDPAEIDLVVELAGMDPKTTRKVISDWFGAWDPKKQGKLCWFSPERGEWFANVRMNKSVSDRFQQDWYTNCGTSFTWSCRNDDAFWQSVPSVCQHQNDDNTISDLFQRIDNGSLESLWNQTQTGPGTCATPTAGIASWTASGTTTGTVINRYVGEGAVSLDDNQWISITVDTPPAPGGYLDIWGRMSSDSQNGMRARLGGNGTANLTIFRGGVAHDVWDGNITLAAGDVITLQCGVKGTDSDTETDTPYYFQILQNGNPLIYQNRFLFFFGGVDYGYHDVAHISNLGPSYRGWGWGMSATGTGTGQDSPGSISKWSAGSDSGFIKLTNIGDQPAWPRYLVYGPGTFLIGNGPGSTDYIQFGPLQPNQVALLSTMPRLPAVTDLTKTQSPAATENIVQELLSSLINFATNNNTPPLLEQFESIFGILPPQGPLEDLLSGRFTVPIDGMSEQTGPVTQYIPCQILNGNNQSKIIASLTPLRRWPE